jgi:hypothetical protein
MLLVTTHVSIIRYQILSVVFPSLVDDFFQTVITIMIICFISLK